MALSQVGLEAVIANLGGFEAGAKAITNAYDTIEKKSRGVEKATAGLGNAFTDLGGGVLKFGAIAGGAALAGTVALTAGIVALGASALTEVAKFERMNLSIQNLVAREISGGKVIEQATQTRIQLTKKESEELEKLQGNLDNESNSRDILTARIQEQKERIRQLVGQYGEQGLVVIKERAELQGMELDLQDLNKDISDHQGRITELTGKQGQLINTLEKVRVGQVSMSEAMSKATPRAQELIKWIQLLAIQSPFTSEGIQNAFQTALAYGFTTEQAQRLTEAEVDFTAATGKSAQAADLIALALGQIQARGKLSAQELRQLSEQGIGTNRILEDMGFSLDDVTNGLVPVDTFIEAVIKDMEVFKGAAKDQATTFSGLVSSLQEIKSVALREFFTGTFEAIRPHLADFVDFLTQASLKTGDIKALGDTLGKSVGSAMAKIADIIKTFQTRGLGGVFAAAGFTGFFKFRDAIKELFDLIASQLPNVTNFGSIFDTLAKEVFPTLTSGIQFVIDHFEEFKGALIGIGTILGAGVFSALVAGILSLLTPINLVIAGAALLGAAWAGNWGDIQGITQSAIDTITGLMTAFQTGGLFGSRAGSFGGAGLLVALGLDSSTVGIIQNSLNTITAIFLTAGEILKAVWAGIMEGIQPIIASFAQIGAAFSGLGISWGSVGQALLQATGMVFSAIGVIIVAAIGAIIGLVSAVAAGVAEMISWWSELLVSTTTIVAGITQLFAGEFSVGLTNIWNGLMETLALILTGGFRIVTAIFKGFFSSVIGFWQGFYNTLVGHSIVPDLIDAIVEQFQRLIAPIEKLTGEVFSKFLEGIEGISDAVKDLTGYFKGLVSIVKNFSLPDVLTPGSPTPFELALIGISEAAQSAAGSMQDFSNALNGANFDKLLGIDRNLTDPLRIAGAAFDDLEKHLDKTIGKGKTGFALTNIKKAIKENISQILTSLNPTKTIDEIAAHAVPNWEKVGIKLQNVGDVFWKSFKENAQDAVATLQDMFIEAGRTAISIGQRLTGVIGGAVDLLNSRVERLQQIVAQGGGEFEGKVLSTVEAQNLLNQALQEQASIQDDILKTKEQEQKLNFLQQQLDLFDTIKEAGLDIGQVLGGLHLGLDASIPDLIAATNKVIEAMINQVNADLGNISSVGAALGNALTSGVTGSLGIASPSKVMQGLADNTMSSFMNRMLSWGPAIAGAAGSAIAGPTMVAAPALASVGAGSQTTINANFGNNNISSGMSEAEFNTRVLRAIQTLMR